MTLTEYLQLLNWTGRQLKPGKRGAIPKNASSILDRLNLSPELCLHPVEHFGNRRAANRISLWSQQHQLPAVLHRHQPSC